VVRRITASARVAAAIIAAFFGLAVPFAGSTDRIKANGAIDAIGLVLKRDNGFQRDAAGDALSTAAEVDRHVNADTASYAAILASAEKVFAVGRAAETVSG
jgi:hypothetical protein